MSDDPTYGPDPAAKTESVMEMILRAYDRSRIAYSESLVASDFRLDLSPSRRRELEDERDAARSRFLNES